MVCFHCGQEYRDVWRHGRLRPFNAFDDRPHSCNGSRREKGEAIRRAKNRNGMTWRPKRRGGKRWTSSEQANKEGSARLKFLLGAG